ncbi:MAG: hypothetical protein JXB35_06840, partial [Anaerolineae bacterium]|nr:hypothetical protein [Anaerolineae bacterium]
YVINNATVYTEFAAWTGRRTKVGEYFLIHGQFLAPLIVFACFQSRELIQRLLHSEDRGLWAALAIVTGGVIILTITMAAVGIPIALIVIPLGILAALMVLDTEQKPESRVLWFFVGTALALTLVVEIIVLKGDLGRMNTVFKFYLQVWMLLAVTGAVALEWLCTKLWGTLQSSPSEETLRGATRLAGKWSWAGDLLLAGLAVLLFTAALYPLFAIPGKIRDRWNRNAPYSLDGMACLESMTHYEEGKSFSLATEVQVMRWLQENVEGSPPIVEMNAAVEYITWGNRMSIYTGLPSVVGWRWHQVQQRMIMPGGTVENRQADVREFYNTPDINAARAILERYNVQYVIVTPYERALAQPEGIAKFTEMATRNWLAPVYTTAEATVYRVNRDTAPVARDPE